MPQSSRDGKAWETTFNVECVHCGLIDICLESEVARVIAEHYIDDHQETVLSQGKHYVAYPSPLRCDCCNVVIELPYWTHVSDPPTSVGLVDSDGLWLVCDTCHGFWAAKDLVGWIRHYMSVVRSQVKTLGLHPYREARVRAAMVGNYRLLLERFDQGTRNTIDNGSAD